MMAADEMLADGLRAAVLVRDALRFVGPLVDKLKDAGTDLESPELRFNCPRESMEFTSGLTFKRKILRGKYITMKIHPPVKARLYSLLPYRPLDGAVTIVRDGIAIDRSQITECKDNRFRVELEYKLQGKEAVSGLVYTSSPRETLSESSESEIERFWLHAELKTVKWLEEIYEKVRLEDIDVRVDVSVSDDLKEVISPELRHEIRMMAKLQSRDRNEQARALAYRSHRRLPKFKGNIFEATQKAQELFQPTKFRRYLKLEGPYRLASCKRGVSLADILLPLDVPRSMYVYSATDLSLEEPAREGKLIYRKSDFTKKLEKILKG